MIPIEEAAFQLSLPEEEILPLVRAGEITAVRVRGRFLLIYDSLVAFARREGRRNRSKPEKKKNRVPGSGEAVAR